MPYPSEHAARINEPGKYAKIRRENGKFGPGIDVIWGITKSGKTEVQAIRFDKSKYSMEQVHAWLVKHSYKPIKSEKASEGDGFTMTSVFQVDTYDMDGKTFIDNAGFLRTDAVVTRTGIFTYQNPDGTTCRQYRPPEEVFKAESLDSMKMIPIVNGHPATKLVTADNAKGLQCGFTGENVKKSGDVITCPLVITDGGAIEHVKGGRNKLSLGYALDLVDEQGEFEGQHYDKVQRNIKYNHLALVDIARAGDIARINLDGEDAVLLNDTLDESDSSSSQKPTPKEDRMQKVNIDGLEYEAAPEVANAYRKSCIALDGEIAKVKSLTTELDTVKAERDTLKAERDTLKLRNIDGDIATGVKSRVELERKADIALDGEEGIEKLTDIEIKTKIIKKQFPEMNLDGKSADYVNAAFDSAYGIISANKDNEGMRSQRKESGSEGLNNDGQKKDARASFIQRTKEAYKQAS
jgi:hypothetical protein